VPVCWWCCWSSGRRELIVVCSSLVLLVVGLLAGLFSGTVSWVGNAFGFSLLRFLRFWLLICP
jgi:hypothetical protein